jgi:hypothetical protein
MRQAHGAVVGLVALMAAASVALAGCGTPSPSSPVPDTGVSPALCALVPQVHAGYADLATAVAAVRAGNNDAASAAGASAVKRAAQITPQLGSIGPGEQGEKALIVYLVSANIGVDQLGRILEDPEASLADKTQASATGVAVIEQTLGSAEALAIDGPNGAGGLCPGLARSGAALPTVAPFVVPSEGPAPPGSVADQTAAALSALGLRAADGIEFRVGSSIQWQPGGGIFIGDVALTNRTPDGVQFPFDLTILRWNGRAWARVECQDGDSTGPARGLCGVVNANAQPLPPGTIRSSAADPRLNFAITSPDGVQPGAYALALPIWRTLQDYPDTEPAEAAIAIVTVTSSR